MSSKRLPVKLTCMSLQCIFKHAFFVKSSRRVVLSCCQVSCVWLCVDELMSISGTWKSSRFRCKMPHGVTQLVRWAHSLCNRVQSLYLPLPATVFNGSSVASYRRKRASCPHGFLTANIFRPRDEHTPALVAQHQPERLVATPGCQHCPCPYKPV